MVVETGEGVVDRVSQLEEEGPHSDPERQMWNRELAGKSMAR